MSPHLLVGQPLSDPAPLARLVPVVKFEIAELERLLRKDVPREELARTIPRLGAEVEEWSGPTWAVEFFPNRPDLYTVEGVARALRAWFGVEDGLRRYEVAPARTRVVVDPAVEGVRPHIGAAFVHGVHVTAARLQALIELQEDLHWGLGAKRRRVAIGIHDAAQVEGPFRYGTVPGRGRPFVPLGESVPMEPGAILAKHPKGVEYAHLVEPERIPVIVDAQDRVVSLPPIINAARTAVTTRSHDLFLDVTGTDAWAVERALNILATALAESGGMLEAVEVAGHGRTRLTPDLAPERRDLRVSEVNRVLGTQLSAEDAARFLRRTGHGAKAAGAVVHVEVPPYRADVLHEWDLVEDVAIGHGYMELGMAPVEARTVGASLPESRLAERARASLVGLGFLETMGLTLSNPRDQFERMRREPSGAVVVKNPVTEDHTLLRVSLLPGLMGVLRKNAHRDLPQRLFEVGTTTRLAEGSVVHERRLAGVLISGRSSFSEVKGVVLALARDLGWKDAQVAKAEDPAFLPGRCASLRVEGRERGVFGETHPEVLAAFGLSHPVTAFDLHLARGPGDAVRSATER